MNKFYLFFKNKAFLASLFISILFLQFQNCAKNQLTSQTQVTESISTDNQKNLSENVCTFNGEEYQIGESVTAYLNTAVPFGGTCKYEKRVCVGPNQLTGTYNFSFCSPGTAAGCLFNGLTYKDGDTITAYQNSSVPLGTSCVSQERTCTNGAWSGSYNFASCKPATAADCSFNGELIKSGSSITTYSTSSVPYGTSCNQVKQVRTCTNGNLSGTYKHLSCATGIAKSCLFNRDTTVPHLGTIIAYQASTVTYGTTCESIQETRLCNNGTLSGTYTFPSCEVGVASMCEFDGKKIAHGEVVQAFSSQTVAYGSSCTSVQTSRTCNNGTLSGDSNYQYSSCTMNSAANCIVDGVEILHGARVTTYKFKDGNCDKNEVRSCYNGALSNSTNNYQFITCSTYSSCSLDGVTAKHGESKTFYHYYNQLCETDNEVRTCNDGVFSNNGKNYSKSRCGNCYDSDGNENCGGG